ncbi:MAG: hypothetical protein NTX72_05355 [Candidatus Uhrbacteria bacterium]|nr:hypothetical protein [Candidatus Uhrbacteria bacterium]
MKFTKQQTTLAHAIGIPVILILAFYGGMQYQKSKTPTFGGGNRTGMMQTGGVYGGGTNGGNRPGRMMNGGFASGDILSKDDKSVTIKLRNGGSQIILLSDKTQVVKADQGALTDLSVGQALTITGTANQDGSITAESIQIRPAMPAQTTPTPKTN